MKKRYIVITGIFLILIIGSLFLFLNNKTQSQELINPNEIGSIIRASSFNPNNNNSIGYEYLDLSGNVVDELNGEVIHIWNTDADYYFDINSGIQFTNYYEEYWTRNVFCGGYYEAMPWVCLDAIPFDLNIQTDNLTYVNYTGYYDINLQGAKLRLNLRYHLKTNDENLTIEMSVENIGNKDVNNDLGFTWIVDNIKIGNNYENDFIYLNDSDFANEGIITRYNLSNITNNITFINMEESFYKLYDIYEGYIRLNWDNSLDYKVEIENVSGQDNAQVGLDINIGNLLKGEKKSTTLYWKDPINLDDISSGTDAGSTGLTVSHTTTGTATDGILVVTVQVTDSALGDRTITSVTHNGKDLTNLPGATSDAWGEERTEIWYRLNPDVGTFNIVVTPGGSCTDLSLGAISFTGVGSSPAFVTQNASGDETPPTLDITTEGTDSWVIDSIASQEAQGKLVPVHETIHSTDVGGDQHAAQYVNASGAGVQTMNYTDPDSDTHWAMSAVSVQLQNSPTVLLNTTNETVFSTTTPTLNFTGFDSESDDIEYNIQIDTINTFDSQDDTSVIGSHIPQSLQYGTTANYIRGEEFGGNGLSVTKSSFYLLKDGSPTGTMFSEIYLYDTGTDLPTGSPLATSESLDLSTVGGSLEWINFTFDGQFAPSNGVKYFITVHFIYTFSDSSNDINVGGESIAGLIGVYSSDGGETWTITGDYNYYVYSGGPAPLISNFSSSDTTFFNTVTPSDTSPFTAGDMINFTSPTELSEDTTYFWRVRGNDTGSNAYGNWSEIRNFTISGEDSTPPTYSDAGVNTTVVSTLANFSILFDDNSALEPLGQYIFSTNNSGGTWTNESEVNFTATPNWANVEKTLNDTVGEVIGYRWYAFDNITTNLNYTEIFVLTITSADTCSPSNPLTGDYTFDCSDACTISSDLDAGGYNVLISGTGTLTLTADLHNYDKITVRGTDSSNICRIKCNGGCFNE